ncbi:MAG TPA: SdrD B-like domain-containing protein, partial [Tepidisphaeraceae bacterium]|nr:SdrD B-like domain-containing protein [Tepidisphaeraceae bacterium]
QYMATAVADYVRNGFTVDTAAPTVTLMNVPNVSGANAAAPYQFTVTYNDNFFLNTSTFDSNDLLVTGPNGFSQKATFVSSGLVWTTSDGHDNRVVTYQIQPPGGAWSSGSDGAYTISLLANQVLDSAGNAAAGGMLTQFTVDTSAPAGSLLAAPNVDSTSLGSTTYTFAVSYSDASGIDLSSLDGNDIEVTSTTGYDALATLNGTSVNGNSVIATYSIAAPSGAWSTDAAGTYNIIQRAGEVRDTFGNTAPAGTLGTFTASFGGGPNPPPASGAISGTVFNDANGNGTIDSRELPMVGVVVYLDTNLNGQLDANEATATTDDTGQYTFNGLSDGRYTVREQSPGGYTVTSPTSGTNTATITGGTPVSGVSFANQLSSLVTGTPSATPSSPSTPTTSPTSPTTTPTSGTPTDTSKPRPKNPGRGHTVKL